MTDLELIFNMLENALQRKFIVMKIKRNPQTKSDANAGVTLPEALARNLKNVLDDQ